MTSNLRTGASIETPSQASNRESELSSSLRDELKVLQFEVEKGKSEMEKKDILRASLENFLAPEEQTILESLPSNEAPSENVQTYLSTASSVLGAIFERDAGRTASSLQEIVDHFSGQNSASIEVSKKALSYIINHPEAPVSGWFLGSAWSQSRNDAHEFFLASLDVETAIGNGQKKGFISKAGEFAKEHKDELKLAALAGGLGLGVWALSRYFSGGPKAETVSSPPGKSSSILKYGAYATGGAFVLGRALGSDWVQDTFATDNNSFLNSRWIKALIAFSHGEFGNALRFSYEGAPDKETQKRNEALSELFGVEVSTLYPISRLKVKDFLDGAPSTLLNLDGQKKADEQIRDRIKTNYLNDLQVITDYEDMTMEVLFLEGLRRGIFTQRDVSTLPEADRLNVLAQRKEDTVRKQEMEVHFANPEENLEALKTDAAELLTDVKEVHDFVPSWWGDTSQYLEAALGLSMFTDSGDDHEYGDVKALKEQILSVSEDGVKKDQKVFTEMAQEVQGFQEFLTAHPAPKAWTSAERTEFDAYKDRMMTIRTQLNTARQTANERNVERLLEDQKELNMDDLHEGVEFALSGLGAGVSNVIRFEMQEVYDGNIMAYTLAVTQVTGAAYAVLQSGKWGVLRTPLTAVKGAAMGPIKTFTLGLDFFKAKTAYSFSSGELLEKYFKGELTKVDLEERLSWAKRYAYMVEEGPMGVVRGMPGPGRTLNAHWAERLRDLSRLEGDLAHLHTWEEHFSGRALLMDGEAAKDALKTHLTDGKIAELKSISTSGANPAARRAADTASRIVTENLPDGRTVIKVDGNVVNIAKTAEEAEAIQNTLIAAGAKQGKHLDVMKLRHILKFAEPLMQIAGVAFTVQLFYRIQNAESPEALQQIVAEETAGLLSFALGAKLTLSVLTKLKKPSTPGMATGYAIMSLMGGLGAALSLDTPLNNMIEKFLDSFPNGYEITEAAGSALEMGSAFGTMKTLQPVAVAIEKKIGSSALKEVVSNRLTALAEKSFAKKLAKSCGWDSIKMLLQKSGWKGGVAAIFGGLDGPAPIGDALGAVFLAWTAKDVYDLSQLIWEGYNLNNELNRRLPMKVAKFNLQEPESLKVNYEQLAETDPEKAFDAILKEPNATVRVQREGDAGYEVWTTRNGEIANLTLYDMKGERIAGLNDEDLERIVKSQEEAAAA